MKPDERNIEDLLSDESFINYCKNTDPADVDRWVSWMRGDPVRQELVDQARAVFLGLFNAIALDDMEAQEALLRNRIQASEELTPVIPLKGLERKHPWSARHLWWKTGAVAAVIGVVVWVGFFHGQPDRKADMRVYTATFGERKSIQLLDGSAVMLNAGSNIRISDHYGVSNREIFLEGEAFFDVKHSKKLPFIVHTKALDVRALGTAFDVKAYAGESLSEATLVQGLVEVTLKEEDNRKVLLHPNQKLRFKQVKTGKVDEDTSQEVEAVDSSALSSSKAAGSTTDLSNKTTGSETVLNIKKTNGGEVIETAWTKNKLVFADQTFGDIAIQLERWYGVHFEFAGDGVRNYRFTGEFDKEQLDTILSLLKESKNFNYAIIPGETTKVRIYK